MPLPIFYLEFRAANGRNPKPAELSTQQRRDLLRCCVQNIERDAQIEAAIGEIDRQIGVLEKHKESLVSRKPNSERWHDLIEESVGLSLPDDEGQA